MFDSNMPHFIENLKGLKGRVVSAGGVLMLKSQTGKVLDSVPVPSTGNFQFWRTISSVVTLPAGTQTLQVYSPTAVNWNINWMQFVSGTGSAGSDAAQLPSLDSAASLSLYPNPVQGNYTVSVNNAYSGKVLIQVIDESGTVRQVRTLEKDQPSMFINMSARDLSSGVYFVRVQMGRWTTIKKMLRQ